MKLKLTFDELVTMIGAIIDQYLHTHPFVIGQHYSSDTLATYKELCVDSVIKEMGVSGGCVEIIDVPSSEDPSGRLIKTLVQNLLDRTADFPNSKPI